VSTPLVGALVDTVRAVFGARATSLALHDEAAGELVFAAVSGEGSEDLPGRRFPASQGVAGWVLTTGQPLTIEDVTQDARFAAGFARSTGYVPKGIMAAPLLGPDGPLGVISVLDRPARSQFSLVEVDLLGRFCNLLVLALDDGAGAAAGAEPGSAAAELAAAVAGLRGPRRAAAERLLEALSVLLDEL
jgi:GAF domain-containing protein